ncbi:hypothetical protein GCM10009539_02680 [Cryptosporangium japonicum]|uniref:Uncharacterized protein n=1 Tax=Cryptosporangium japonicum TaxID=80872 RepID=A0ABN0TG76_9ACTN
MDHERAMQMRRMFLASMQRTTIMWEDVAHSVRDPSLTVRFQAEAARARVMSEQLRAEWDADTTASAACSPGCGRAWRDSWRPWPTLARRHRTPKSGGGY